MLTNIVSSFHESAFQQKARRSRKYEDLIYISALTLIALFLYAVIIKYASYVWLLIVTSYVDITSSANYDKHIVHNNYYMYAFLFVYKL